MNSGEQRSIGFMSLGCVKNLVDSEVMADNLISSGFILAPSPEKADIIIVNTCAFIHDAREESIDAILDACRLKENGNCRAVIVAGCLPQRYKRELVLSLPEVDAFIGLDEVNMAGEVAARLMRGERGIVEISESACAVIEPSPERLLFTSSNYAYVKVSEGCDHSCSFCAIPQIRGHYRSRSIKSIVAEAESLLSRGVRELNLISQDVTSYGRDLGHDSDLPKLLRALGGIGGKFWVRLLYGYPGHVTVKLLETMGDMSQICHYLDLPIQHSHSAMRLAMGRKGTESGLKKLFQRIRRILPDVTLRTTCLVGFPGETDEYFRNLIAFIKELRFDHLCAFTFSREKNTRAATLSNCVSASMSQKRMERLLKTQKRIVNEKAVERIGHVEEVFIEQRSNDPDTWIGRSKGEAPEIDGVVFLKSSSRAIAPGMFVKARYVAQQGYDMEAVEDR